MTKKVDTYATPGGGTVTIHHAGLLGTLAGHGTWYECAACPGTYKVMDWSNGSQGRIVDREATEEAAVKHARNCIRKPSQ